MDRAIQLSLNLQRPEWIVRPIQVSEMLSPYAGGWGAGGEGGEAGLGGLGIACDSLGPGPNLSCALKVLTRKFKGSGVGASALVRHWANCVFERQDQTDKRGGQPRRSRQRCLKSSYARAA